MGPFRGLTEVIVYISKVGRRTNNQEELETLELVGFTIRVQQEDHMNRGHRSPRVLTSAWGVLTGI